MRILHILHRYAPCIGGSERYMQEISERFVREGHTVDVYTTNARDIEYFFDRSQGVPVTEPAREKRNGVSVHRFPLAHFPGRKIVMHGLTFLPWWDAQCIGGRYQPLVPGMLQRSFTERRFDIVHATSSPFSPLLYMAYRFARENKAPFILTPFLHIGHEEGEGESMHTQTHLVKLWKKADALLVQTPTERDFVAGYGVLPDRIHLVGVGISPSQLGGGMGPEFRSKMNLSPDEPLIGHIARLDFNKGTEHLLQAMELLWKKGVKCTLVLIGTFTYSFKRVWDQMPAAVRQHCILLENVDEQTKKNVLDAIDLFVMPSRVESFGIVYLESWFYRTPVIGADAGAVRDIIADGTDGFLVQFGDVASLAERIDTVLSSPEVRRTMGAEGYRKTMEKYTWDTILPKIRSIYEQAIRSKLNGQPGRPQNEKNNAG